MEQPQDMSSHNVSLDKETHYHPIFFLIFKGLSSLLQVEHNVNNLVTLLISCGAPYVSCFLFTDNSLLLWKPTANSCHPIKNVLDTYIKALSQLM